MKLKHRKLILIISMSAMGIGLITFSIAGSKDKESEEAVNLKTAQVTVAQDAGIDTTGDFTETETPTPTAEVTQQLPTEAPTDAITETPTPTQELNAIKENGDKEITTLVKSYLQAKLDGKSKKLKKLVTDPSSVDVDMMQKKTEFIESYDNVKVYTKTGTGDVDYIAYVYEEVKIASIDTKAPGMDEYLIKKVDNDYKIVSGKISDDTSQYVQEARKADDVQDLIKKVNSKLSKAIKKDDDLADFCKKLEVTPKAKKKKKK